MRSLGISTLFSQTFVGETAESKQLSRTDSDSLLAVVSKDLERCLQKRDGHCWGIRRHRAA